MGNVNQWVLIKRFAEITGYSENAIRHKVQERHFGWRAASGAKHLTARIFVNAMVEFERWVESETHTIAF